MDHWLEGSSPTSKMQACNIHQSGPSFKALQKRLPTNEKRGAKVEGESHVICGLIMTIKSHRGKWRRSSPTNAALRSWSRIKWAVKRIWKKGALRFAKKTTNNVAQHVQWILNALQSIMLFRHKWTSRWKTTHIDFWILVVTRILIVGYLDLANPAQAYIQLRQVRAFKRCTRPHLFASTCKTTLC